MLRTTLTGVHALETGIIVTDLTRLLDRHGLGEAQELIAEKRRGEKAELPAALQTKWSERVQSLFDLLDRAEAQSHLPAEADPEPLEKWLIQHRLARLERR